MSKRRRSRRRSTRAPKGSPLIAVLVGAAIVVLFIIFIFTGSDPVGVFGGDDQAAAPAIRPALSTAGGDWWQVYFTDPVQSYDPDNLSGTVPEKLIQRIDGAQKRNPGI